MGTPPERSDPLNRLLTTNKSLLRYSALLHLKRYSIACYYAKGKTLDIACGTGYGIKLLITNRSVQYFGVDINEEAIVQAKEKYGHFGSFSVTSKKAGLAYDDNIFDTVCSLETIEHLEKEEQPAFYCELLRVLKPKGVLIISTPNRNYKSKIALKKIGWNNPYHKYEFATEEFKHFLLNSTEQKIEILNSYYLGLPYNVTGAVHKHRFENFLRRLPKRFLSAIDSADIKLGIIFPQYCNSLEFVIIKI